MSLTVADLETVIKWQAGELEIAKLQIMSLQGDLRAALQQKPAEAPAPNRATRRSKAK